jgi:UDP-N-acetylglucosamine transferase subunit ALG13
MIFVTIGTSEPFDRLLRAVDALPGEEELIVQVGASTVRPERATCVPFVPYEEVVESIRAARVVVTHAGAGSVLTCLVTGKRPIVVPRLSRYGETSDNHQLAFGRRLDEIGLVTLVEDLDVLAETIGATSSSSAGPRSAQHGLAHDLRGYLESVVGDRPSPAGSR